MRPDYEQVLNKAFEEAKMASGRAGTSGRFAVTWDIKNDVIVSVRKTIEESKQLPKQG